MQSDMILHIMIYLGVAVLAVLIYLASPHKLRIVVDDDQPIQVDYYASPYHKPLNAGLNSQISQRLDVWVATRGYTQQGVTINDIAAVAATNRTYLSKYINETYRCSFRVWVNRLRIARAKELLLDEEVLIEEVAREVGFASCNSFAHSFKRYEGRSTTQWRREQQRGRILREAV